jgi:hypothetical protein
MYAEFNNKPVPRMVVAKNIDYTPDITSDEYWDRHHIAVVRVAVTSPQQSPRVRAFRSIASLLAKEGPPHGRIFTACEGMLKSQKPDIRRAGTALLHNPSQHSIQRPERLYTARGNDHPRGARRPGGTAPREPRWEATSKRSRGPRNSSGLD